MVLALRAENDALRDDRQALESSTGAANHHLEAEVATLRGQNQETTEELERLRATKLFRWSAPARRVYGRIRR